MSLRSVALNSAYRALIGRGIKHPFSFSDTLGGVQSTAESEGIEKVNSSIYVSLSTRKGEYFMHPSFGSNLHKLLFEPYSPVLRDRIRLEVADTIARCVPQIRMTGISVDDSLLESESTLVVRGEYMILNTPVRGSFVFPFNAGVGPMD